MERLVAMMAFCETPLDGTSAPSGAAMDSASATGGGDVVALLEAATKKWPVDRLVATMAFCEAPLDGIFDGTSAPSSGAAGGDSASAAGGGNVVALLDAATKKWPVDRLVATMAFCEAPLDGTFDGTSAPSSGAAGGDSASAAGGGNVVALLDAAAKQWPMQRLVATMAFCEAPLDGTSAPSSSGGAAVGSASDTNVPEAGGGGGEDAAALRRAWLADAKKEWPLPSYRLLREKAGTVVDGLAIFETVALQ